MKIVLLLFLFVRNISSDVIYDDNPILRFYPCLGSDILYEYQYEPPDGKETRANITIPSDEFKEGRRVSVFLAYNDAHVNVVPQEGIEFRSQSGTPAYTTFTFDVAHDYDNVTFIMNGHYGLIPYVEVVKVNGVSNCDRYLLDFLDNILLYKTIARELRTSVPDKKCGRRKAENDSSRPGHWPWHAAIYRKEENNTFICGGTLISKLHVLTAAHCATIDKNPVTPDILSVVFGKQKFEEYNGFTQERGVSNVIVHEEFGSPKLFDNDIALLKLDADVVYTDHVQPACLWSKKLSIDTSRQKLTGKVQWWESNHNNSAPLPEISQTSFPLLSDQECANKNLTLLNILLSEKKFCTRWENSKFLWTTIGTLPHPSPCNADSGGGVMVDVPAAHSSVWYLRGIVPQRSVCRSGQHALFIDLAKYEEWIQNKLFSNIIKVATLDKERLNPRLGFRP